MAAGDPLRLGVAATAVLDLATSTLEAAGRAVSKAYIAHNAPAWDLCQADQLAVYVLPIAFRGKACQVQAQPNLHVQMVRCVPTLDDAGAPPTATALTESGLALLDDFMLVSGVIIDAARDLFGSCESITWGTATPLGPSGAAAAWDWSIQFTL